MMLISYSGFSQNDKFICTYDDWADRHNENEKWNSLLDEACKEINEGNYRQAISTLDEAIAIDSAANEGDINVFIETQYRRLKDFVENSPAVTTTTENTNPETPPQAPIENTVKEPEVVPSTVLVPLSIGTTEVVEPTIDNNISQASIPELSEPEIKNEPSNEELVKPEKEEPTKEPELIYTEPEPNLGIEQENIAVVLEDNDEPEEISFNEAEKTAFQEKGMQKVKQLENFIFQVGSKSSPMSLSSQAIENAIKLFDKEERTVQVSSLNVEAKPKFKIRQYLQRVRNLNYDDITIEWADLQYASDFTKGPDDNYYAYVVFSQRFTGSKDNQVIYTDVTTKRTQIILKIYEKAVQGEITENWDVFLGDISVMQTDTN